MMEVASKRIENVLVEHGCQRGLEPDKCERERALLFFIRFPVRFDYLSCVLLICWEKGNGR